VQWTRVWLLEHGGQFAADFNQATAFRQRRFFERWQEVVSELRPELPPSQVRELGHVVWSIMNGTVYFPSELTPHERAAVLTDDAYDVLMGPAHRLERDATVRGVCRALRLIPLSA
jgi:hypothetical protein